MYTLQVSPVEVAAAKQEWRPCGVLIFFPWEEDCWHEEMQEVQGETKGRRGRLIQAQFFAYRRAFRSLCSRIHSSGELFQRYIADLSSVSTRILQTCLRTSLNDVASASSQSRTSTSGDVLWAVKYSDSKSSELQRDSREDDNFAFEFTGEPKL
jgi:hypothetical protein